MSQLMCGRQCYLLLIRRRTCFIVNQHRRLTESYLYKDYENKSIYLCDKEPKEKVNQKYTFEYYNIPIPNVP